jgi:hypothetical protein
MCVCSLAPYRIMSSVADAAAPAAAADGAAAAAAAAAPMSKAEYAAAANAARAAEQLESKQLHAEKKEADVVRVLAYLTAVLPADEAAWLAAASRTGSTQNALELFEAGGERGYKYEQYEVLREVGKRLHALLAERASIFSAKVSKPYSIPVNERLQVAAFGHMKAMRQVDPAPRSSRIIKLTELFPSIAAAAAEEEAKQAADKRVQFVDLTNDKRKKKSTLKQAGAAAATAAATTTATTSANKKRARSRSSSPAREARAAPAAAAAAAAATQQKEKTNAKQKVSC